MTSLRDTHHPLTETILSVFRLRDHGSGTVYQHRSQVNIAALADAKKALLVTGTALSVVMQLQVKPDEAYFIRSHQDAIGGIRTAPSLNLLRIDHCQHALVALMKARRVLYP